MSRIYDALKKLEAERAGRKNGETNGQSKDKGRVSAKEGQRADADESNAERPEVLASGRGDGEGSGRQADGNGSGTGNGGAGNGDDRRSKGNGRRATGNGDGNGRRATGNGDGNGRRATGNGDGNGRRATGHGNGRRANGSGGNGHGNGRRANGSGGNGHGSGGNGHGNGGNGHGNGGNGHGNGGNGHGNGKRRGWRWLFGNGNGHANGRFNGTPAIHFDLRPDAEDAYQRLGTNLLAGPATETEQPKLLALTASRHGEGTTTTAAVFSSILVRRRGGRVAVVEANLRSPGFDTAFGIMRNGGFAELVMGEQSLAEVAQATSIPGLFAIGCGTTTLAPSALFDAPGLDGALEQLRKHFDFVIFDTPPVNVYGDSQILCPHLDAAVIVIEADRTRMPEVERARRTLERVGVRLAGSVLNRRRNYIPAVLEEML